jgi:iron complex transport system ATP-binding protein
MSAIQMRAEGITFAYQNARILDDVNLELGPGEIVGIVGPNGSGKSTLVKCLSRVLMPQRGKIWLDGCELARLTPTQVARRVAVVPQVFELPAGFTAFEIVLMGRTPHLGWLQPESARDRAVTHAAMEATHTWHLADRTVNRLSGGERQRIVIARALAQEPEVLLLDEPTAHLDIRHQIEVMEMVRKLSRERGLAVLGVFHDLNLAAQYCQRIILLKEGRVYAAGLPQTVITNDTLRQVYEVELCVFPHPRNQLPAALIVGK